MVEIRDISEAKLYYVHTICETFATSQEDLTNIIPYHAITGCDAVSDIAGHGKGSAWNAFCSNPDLLANLGKGDFHDETYSSYPRSSSAGCSIFLMRAAVVMHGWLCLASVEYLKHCHLPTSNAPQLHIQRAHYQSMVWIQATCNIPFLPPQPETMGWSKGNGTLVATVMPVAPMCRSYHMRMNHMMHLREMWLQKRKHPLHKIVQVQILSPVWTMTVDDVVKRKCHSSSCFLYKTKMFL